MTDSYESLLALGVLIPLISFTFLAFFGARLGKPLSAYVATAAIGTSCVLSSIVLWRWLGLSASEQAQLTENANRYVWALFGEMPIRVGVKLDSLTVAMYFMVTFIAFWIHWFSIGYMAGHSDEVGGQSKYHRFFAYLSLFCFSMLGLVISSSLLFLFIFWELVGLCSYLLIGYYFDRKYASDAAMKAFITNRVGDFGFLCGLMLVVLYLGTFDLDQAAVTFELASHKAGVAPMREQSAFASHWLETSPALVNETQAAAARGAALFSTSKWGLTLATLLGIGLFCGAIGKSAQVPLQVWLPDAMAGPTPVSALIHAATMVAAGVYLVARIFRLLTPEAQMFIAVIGCVTLTIAALIAVVQTDIKKVLAYSTLSQLGYMVFGMGIGAWTAALFHLIAHAFFKALMFLGSGQVIEGCHHEQDIRNMGGLRRKMPVTAYTFLIGVLAIAGFGIPAVYTGHIPLGLGGYFSKDEILAVAHDRTFTWPGIEDADHDEHSAAPVRTEHGIVAGATAQAGEHHKTVVDEHGHDQAAGAHAAGDHHDVHAESRKAAILGGMPALPRGLFWLPLIIAYVTPFYMMRCWLLTFGGKPRDHHVYDHAHESPMMWIPLAVLAVGTLFSSYNWLVPFRPMLADSASTATDAPLVVGLDGVAELASQAAGERINVHAAHNALAYMVGFSWVAGFVVAWLIYRNGLVTANRLAKLPFLRTMHWALQNKLGFDWAYDNILVNGTVLVARICKGAFDAIIDLIVNTTANITARLADFTGRQMDMPIKPGDVGAVDALVNGVGYLTFAAGNNLRKSQSGRIRVYLTLASAAAAIVLIFVLFGGEILNGVVTALLWTFANRLRATVVIGVVVLLIIVLNWLRSRPREAAAVMR